MPRWTAMFLTVAFSAAALAGGCAPRDPVGVWRDQLGSHLRTHAGGSPAGLRDLPALRNPRAMRTGQIVFGAVDIPGPGLPLFARVHDVQGVLVGEVRDGGREWYVFVTGLTARHPSGKVTLEEVRLAAFRTIGTTLEWRVGEDDRRESNRYGDYRWSVQAAPRGRQWGDRLPVAAEGAFPGDYDDFQLRILRPGVVVVREAHSGAEWQLALHREQP